MGVMVGVGLGVRVAVGAALAADRKAAATCFRLPATSFQSPVQAHSHHPALPSFQSISVQRARWRTRPDPAGLNSSKKCGNSLREKPAGRKWNLTWAASRHRGAPSVEGAPWGSLVPPNPRDRECAVTLGGNPGDYGLHEGSECVSSSVSRVRPVPSAFMTIKPPSGASL